MGLEVTEKSVEPISTIDRLLKRIKIVTTIDEVQNFNAGQLAKKLGKGKLTNKEKKAWSKYKKYLRERKIEKERLLLINLSDKDLLFKIIMQYIEHVEVHFENKAAEISGTEIINLRGRKTVDKLVVSISLHTRAEIKSIQKQLKKVKQQTYLQVLKTNLPKPERMKKLKTETTSLCSILSNLESLIYQSNLRLIYNIPDHEYESIQDQTHEDSWMNVLRQHSIYEKERWDRQNLVEKNVEQRKNDQNEKRKAQIRKYHRLLEKHEPNPEKLINEAVNYVLNYSTK